MKKETLVDVIVLAKMITMDKYRYNCYEFNNSFTTLTFSWNHNRCITYNLSGNYNKDISYILDTIYNK